MAFSFASTPAARAARTVGGRSVAGFAAGTAVSAIRTTTNAQRRIRSVWSAAWPDTRAVDLSLCLRGLRELFESLRRKRVQRPHGQLEVLRLRVLELRVREAAQALHE